MLPSARRSVLAGGEQIERGLDFFVRCEAACREVREHVARHEGENATRDLQRAVLRDVNFAHDLSLQTLNDRLKRYPFVDPQPFDELLTEIFGAVLEWLRWITDPRWIVQVLHQVGTMTARGRAAAAALRSPRADIRAGAESPMEGLRDSSQDQELTDLARFSYPVPLKLRDLQSMIRPFMEVRSTHHIDGLDAVVSELIRALLRVFHTIKAWDEKLVQGIMTLYAAKDESSRITALCGLCAMLELDVFEADHHLHHVDGERFLLTKGEIERILQKLPLFQDQRMLHGPPSLAVEREGALFSPGGRDENNDRVDCFGFGDGGEINEVRSEVLRWWREQQFITAAPTRIVATALLTHLVDHGLHPDPFVSEGLPRVLENIFGVQATCKAFMNRLLPKLGGYVNSTGVEVEAGKALPLLSDVPRCAESLLIFLRQWSEAVDLVEGSLQIRMGARNTRGRRASRARRGSQFDMVAFVDDLQVEGHTSRDMADLLEGGVEIPHHVLNVPVDPLRYHVDEGKKRAWELATDQHHDTQELLGRHHRDLGPYMHLDIDKPEDLAELWKGRAPAKDHAGLRQDLHRQALMSYVEAHGDPRFADEEEDEEDPYSMKNLESFCPAWRRATLMQFGQVSDWFGLKLVDWPAGVDAGECSASTFLRYFSDGARLVSRYHLHGLPPLPWSFGSDTRNSLIVDVPTVGLAPFHCMFAQSTKQKHRACVIALGSQMAPTYIVCPKYQPLQIHNGDRLVCHSWTFEMRILPLEKMHSSSLSILTDEGDVFEVPSDGCHVGAGNRSRHLEHQPSFPPTKFALKHRLTEIAAVHLAIHYHQPTDRWTLIDHSPDPMGTLILCKPGVARPLSHGLRVKIGPVTLETVIELND